MTAVHAGVDDHAGKAFCILLLFPLTSFVAFAQTVNSGDRLDSAGESSDRMETIVVETTGEPDSEQPLGTSISGKTVSTAPGSGGDPLRTLQSFPGLVFADDSEPLPAVRGSRPDDNYFEVDFIETDYLFHVGGLISVFHPDLIKSFSIYPSAYGPEYTGVNGGVFDVELREPKKDRLHGSLDISLLQAGFLLEGPIAENQSFYLAGRISYLDLLIGDQLDDEDDEGFTVVQFPRYTDYQSKYVWQANDRTRVTAQANGATDDAAFDIDESADEIQVDPVLAGRFQQGSSFNQQSVTLDIDLNDGATLKTAIGHSSDEQEIFIGGAGSIALDRESWLTKSHLNFTLGEDHDLTLGATVSFVDFNANLDFNVPICTEFEPDCTLTDAERIAVSINDDVTFAHLFIKDTWYFNDYLTLFSGLSFQSENLLNESQLEPRFALEYQLSDSVVLSAGVGLYSQAPEFEQSNRELGNPELKFIESTQAVVGIEKKWDNGWQVKTELYYKRLDDLVTGDDELAYLNNGEGETIGIDTLVRKNLTKKLSGWFSLSLSDSRRTNRVSGERFDFEFDQPFNASVVANYKINKKWSAGAKLGIHSGALFTPVTGSTPDPEIEGFFNPVFGPLNSERFPTYRRLDVRIDRTVVRPSGRTYSAYFEILNVLGDENIAAFEYNADYSEREGAEQIPTIFAFGFKAEF